MQMLARDAASWKCHAVCAVLSLAVNKKQCYRSGVVRARGWMSEKRERERKMFPCFPINILSCVVLLYYYFVNELRLSHLSPHICF